MNDEQPGDKRQPRIVFMASTLPVGGAETHLVTLMHGLRDRGFSPRLILFKEPGALGEHILGEQVPGGDDLPVCRGIKRHGVTPALVIRIAAKLRRIRPRCLVTLEHDDVLFAGRIAARLARVPRIVTIMHTTDRRDGSPTVTRLMRWMGGFSDLYVATAMGHRDHLIRQGIAAQRIEVIRNAIDTLRFTPQPRVTGTWSFLGLPPEARTIGMVAAFRPEKNHGLALEAVAALRERHSDAHLLLFGDGPLRPTIARRAAELGVSRAVHLLGVRHDLEQLLPQIDLAILTSRPRVETLSFAMLEVMACGRPVVATDVGFLSEAIEDRVNGSLVAPGITPSELAKVLDERLRDRDRLERMGRAARRTIEERFSLERMLGEYARLLAVAPEPGARNG